MEKFVLKINPKDLLHNDDGTPNEKLLKLMISKRRFTSACILKLPRTWFNVRSPGNARKSLVSGNPNWIPQVVDILEHFSDLVQLTFVIGAVGNSVALKKLETLVVPGQWTSFQLRAQL